MSAAHALDNLYKQRLKASTLTDMNDPFELQAISMRDRELRSAIMKWRTEMSRVAYVLCFSTTWRNPVLWSHYAEKHFGMALGFDVPDQFALQVRYQSSRLEIDWQNYPSFNDEQSKELVTALLLTKFAAWKYEEEVRMLLKPSETHEEMGLSFTPFSDQLQLKEVILGPRCTVSNDEVSRAAAGLNRAPEVIRARLAFKSFEVVRSRSENRGK